MTGTLTYAVTPRTLTDRCTAVVRGEMPVDEMPAWLCGVFHAVRDYLTRARVSPTGPPFARFTVLGDEVAAEAGFPVPAEVSGDGLVEPSALPDGPAAVTTHWGSYEDVEEAYAACLGWLDERGYRPAGPHWEVYHTDPDGEPDPARWRTDVVVPFRAPATGEDEPMLSVRRPVLVGVDGSPGCLAALDVAADEAAVRRLPLRLVHVARVDLPAGRAIVAEAAARTCRRHPHLAIDVEVVRGNPGRLLAEESAEAAVTVLGCRGIRGPGRPLAGSVSSLVAGHGYGPVLVVRGERPAGRPVVVGVDGDRDDDPAIGFAFEEADMRGVPLRPILVWKHPPRMGVAAGSPADHRAEAARAAEAALETALQGWRLKYPDVVVAPTLVHSRHPARRLHAATADADLVVVGCRGRRGLPGGSVGHLLVHHARCPVAIVRPERI